MKMVVALALCAVLAGAAHAQQRLTIGKDTFSFHLPGQETLEVYFGDDIAGASAQDNEDTQEIWRHFWWVIEDVCKHAGCNRVPFALGLTGGIGNAYAMIHKGARVIVFDGSEWGGKDSRRRFVIAHEIGHHICGHTEQSHEDNPWKGELEADRFAGMAMRGYDAGDPSMPNLMGAISEAQQLFPEKAEPGSTHPPRDLRIAAIIEGYKSGSLCVHRIPSMTGGGLSLWEHNRSIVYLDANGTQRRFHYHQPRPGLKEVGVAHGTILFEGQRIGDRYVGKAYIFSKTCPPISYEVSGVVSADQREVTMVGKAPLPDRHCRILSYRDDVLVFRNQAGGR
ncbi:MAG: M48 family metalloprotease [Hyphomicrobiaceae bacterium]